MIIWFDLAYHGMAPDEMRHNHAVMAYSSISKYILLSVTLRKKYNTTPHNKIIAFTSFLPGTQKYFSMQVNVAKTK